MDSEKLEKIIHRLLSYHEKMDFAGLSSLMDDEVLQAEDSFFSEDKFKQVSKGIADKLGKHSEIQHICNLDRESELLTLWCCRYTKSDSEMLWQLLLKRSNMKIVNMSLV